MSITIYSTASNHTPDYESKECWCIDPNTDQANPNCYDCKGEGIADVSLAPEINMSNTNALSILELILDKTGIQVDHAGDIPNNRIPDVIRRIMFLLNTTKEVGQAIRPTEIDGNMYSMGMDKEYIERQLNRVLEVLKYAQEHGEDVVWG